MANTKYSDFTTRMGVELDAYNLLAQDAFGIPVQQIQNKIGAGLRMASLPPTPAIAATVPAAPTSGAIDPGWVAARSRIQGGAESNGDPNTLFNNAQGPGGPFEGVKVADMTLNQVLDFQDPSGPYAAYVRSKVGRTATPTGANQVVGSTLKAAMIGLGLTGDEKYTPETQDKIGQWIYKNQGLGAWEAFNKGTSGFTPPTFKAGRASVGDMTPTDYSKLREEAEKELDPKQRRNQSIGAMLSALGQGLGQMSHGRNIDVGDIFSSVKDRQDRARAQLTEVAKLEALDKQRLQGHGWDVAAQQTMLDNQAAMANFEQTAGVTAENRQEQRGIASETRATDKEAEHNQLLSKQLEVMYGDRPWGKQAAAVAAVDPTVAVGWANSQADNDAAQAKVTREQGQFDSIAKSYEAEIPNYPGKEAQLATAAEAARNGDLATARQTYAEVTGKTASMKDAEIVAAGGAPAEAMLRLKRSEAGSQDPVTAGYYDVYFKDMVKDNEWLDTADQQQAQMASVLSILKDPSLDTGAFQKLMLPYASLLSSMGITDPTKTDKQSVFDAATQQIVLNAQKPGQGSISDPERVRFDKISAELGKSPIANEVLLYGQNLNTNKERDRILLDRQYVNDKGEAGLKDDRGRKAWVEQQLNDKYKGQEAIRDASDPSHAADMPAGQPYFYGGKIWINRIDPKTGELYFDDGTLRR